MVSIHQAEGIDGRMKIACEVWSRQNTRQMAPNHAKLLEALIDALRQSADNATQLAVVACGALLVLGVALGTTLALWIFRGGLSRCANLRCLRAPARFAGREE